MSEDIIQFCSKERDDFSNLSGTSGTALISSGLSAVWGVIQTIPDVGKRISEANIGYWIEYAKNELLSGRAGSQVQRALDYATDSARYATKYDAISKFSVGAGALFDFASQLLQGEDVGHAIIKSGAHAGLGFVAGAVSAVIITNPVVAAGAAIVGSVILTGAFDDIYDEYLKEPIDNLWAKIVT